MEHRVIEPDAVEPHHPGADTLEPVDPLNDGSGVVAPVADLKGPLNREVRVLCVERETLRNVSTSQMMSFTARQERW